MLRLTNEQRAEAAFLIHQGILAGEDQYEILARLGEDFDVEPMESWPEASMSGSVNLPIPEPSDQSGYVARSLEQRAIDAALAHDPKPGKVTSRTKIL